MNTKDLFQRSKNEEKKYLLVLLKASFKDTKSQRDYITES